MPEIQMPKLSDTMTEGTLVAWKKKKGDQVSAGEVLAEIETDKATMEWESPEDGTLTEIYVEEGGKGNVGDKIGFLTFTSDEANIVADVHLAALLHVNFSEGSVFGRFPFHRRLVCLNLSEHFASRDLIALLFLPRDKSALRHRVA